MKKQPVQAGRPIGKRFSPPGLIREAERRTGAVREVPLSQLHRRAGFPFPNANSFTNIISNCKGGWAALIIGRPNFMLNNAKLKDTLSQIMTAKTAEPIQLHPMAAAEMDWYRVDLTVADGRSVFSLSFDEAQSQMKRIQEMVRDLGIQPTIQHQPAPALAGLPQAASKPGSRATSAPVRIQTPFKHAASPAPMTDKQKRMIFARFAKKALEAEQVEELLIKQVDISAAAI